MSGAQDAKRNGRRSRPLSAQEKYQIWQQLLTGELTQRQAAEQWNPTTILRIRRVGREGAQSALAQSRPGVRAGAGSAQDAELRRRDRPTVARPSRSDQAAFASAEGVWQPTIAGASRTRSSFSRASTMNSAKSIRRVRLLLRIGSPTWRLHTGRP